MSLGLRKPLSEDTVVSLSDYFEGYDVDFGINFSKESPKYSKFDFQFSSPNNSAYILELVRIETGILYSFQVDEKLLFVFYAGASSTLYVYNIEGEVYKHDKEYDYSKLFLGHEKEDVTGANGCKANHISYRPMNDENKFLIVSCKDNSEFLRSSYTLKIFKVLNISESEFKIKLLDLATTAYEVKKSALVVSPKHESNYFLVLSTKPEPFVDSIIFLIKLVCTSEIE